MRWFMSGLIVLVSLASVVGAAHGEKSPLNPNPISEERPTALETDVLVVGATEGGVAAAIQAARLGARVILTEETDWIGGQMTAAAVTSMDGHIGGFLPGLTRYTFETGLYGEFMARIKDYYAVRGKSVGTCYYADWTYCFEPAVGQRVMRDMLNEAGRVRWPIERLHRIYPVEVLTEHNQVIGVVFNDGTTITAKQVIDATTYGDVIALSPAAYRAGNSTSDALSPNACVQDITYTAVMKKYPTGVPENLVFRSAPPGYSDALRDQFAAEVAHNGNSWRDKERKVGLRGWPILRPVDWAIHNAYRGMPDSTAPGSATASKTRYRTITRTGVNWVNDYAYTVADLDRQNRKNTNCRAKLYTLQFLYYVQEELQERRWAIANDQGFDTPYNTVDNRCADVIPAEFAPIEQHFPQIPYVRESRRIKGTYTLTAPEEMRFKYRKSSVGLHDMGLDLHGCKTAGDFEQEFGERPEHFGYLTYQLPIEIFIPETVDGLLPGTGKLLSVSRLINGASRNQPASMLTGQAAGAIAALAVRLNTQPRHLDVQLVQDALLDEHNMLMQFTDVPDSHPYFKGINVAALKGLMIGHAPGSDAKGRRTFGPEGRLTRAQIALLVGRLFRYPMPNPGRPTFIDVPRGKAYYPHVEALWQRRLSVGCAYNRTTRQRRFCPNSPARRVHLAVYIVREAGWPLLNPTRPTYSDVPRSYTFYRHIETAAAHGLFPTGGAFDPMQPITRGETAEVIYRYLDEVGDWPDVDNLPQ